jgi:hypothetical protein
MKTITRAAWPWLLLAVTCGCSNAKKLEIHYAQIEACQTWSDQNDNPDTAFVNPLVVFRLVSVTNTSAKGTPNITFDLQRVFDNSGGVHHNPEVFTSIPSFGDIGKTLAPGQSIRFPQRGIPGLFALQPFDTQDDVRGLEFYLFYDSASDESVTMVRDPSRSTFQPYCGKTALSGLQ